MDSRARGKPTEERVSKMIGYGCTFNLQVAGYLTRRVRICPCRRRKSVRPGERVDPRCQSPEDTGSKLQGPIPQIGNFVNVKTDVLEPRYRAGYVCTQVQIGTLIAMDLYLTASFA